MGETVYDRVVLLLQRELEHAYFEGVKGNATPGRDDAARIAWKIVAETAHAQQESA